MQADCYLGIDKEYSSEYHSGGSKFYGFLFPVQDVDTFEEKISKMKKKFSDASHVCSACVIGLKKEYQRCSDDGEPSNSSGRPILNTLRSAELTYVGCAVVRYYGGKKLGIPGLISAYGGASAACVGDAFKKTRVMLETMLCTIQSSEAYRLYNFLAHYKEVKYSTNETGQFEITCPRSMTERLRTELKKFHTLQFNFLIMYKTKVIFFLLLASLLTQPTFAQHISAKPNNALRAILRGIDLPENTILEHYYTISSPFAQHFSFRQTTLGKEVKHHGIKVHLKHDGSYSVQDFLSFAPISSTYTTGNTFVLYNNELQAASKNSIENSRRPLEQWVRSDGLVLLEVEGNKFVRKDTAIFGKVFKINPINSSGQPYGGSFVDNNDQTNGALDSQLVWRELPVIYHNDTFLFESEFMYFKDISAPLDTFFYVFSDSLAYTRDIGAFEFVNAYYHINTVGKYVNKLGYDELTEPLAVDVHAFDGWDNSAYTPGAHTLQFGDGGIDDAEDGEVIIHEFAHSLSELASPNNTVGSQREAMEEGSCDYFAKAYSRSINDNTPNKVFTWDGNEFWNGFKINTKRIYPQDLKTSKDGDRDMWSSALMCAHDKIGRVATDSLLLEHFYYQAANTTMTQMAQIILDIDSADFNKRYFAALKQCFVKAGFIKHGASIAVHKNSDAIKIFNQQGFAAGTAPIEIVAPSLASFSLYGASGAKIHTQKSEKLLLSPDFYEKGMYVIQIETSNAIYTLKVIR